MGGANATQTTYINKSKDRRDDSMKENGLLEIIAAHRTMADLDEILKKDSSFIYNIYKL